MLTEKNHEKISITSDSSSSLNAALLEYDFGSSDDDSILEMLKKIKKPEPLKKKKYRREGRVSVTELSQMNWCEIQHNYEKVYGRPAPTKSMLTGIKRHSELEKEVHTLIKVKTLSHVDSEGLKLYDMLSRLNSYKKTGIAREIRVFGFLKLLGKDSSIFVTGIIDLIQRKPPAPGSMGKEYTSIIDNKTRMANSIPTQKKSSNQQLQLMLYQKLFEELISCGKKASAELRNSPTTFENIKIALNGTGFLIDQVFIESGIKHDDRFSDVFLEQLFNLGASALLGRSPVDRTPISILDIFKALLLCLGSLPDCSSELTLSYEHQKTRRHIGELKFNYNPNLLAENIQRSLEYLLCVRPPTGVTDIEEAVFKCGNCNFADQCDWRKNMATIYSNKKLS